jgi:anti-sigma factor RsiW
MNSSQCKQFEIEIIDDILGNLPLKRAQALQYHLAQCSSCKRLYGEWSELLKDDTRVHPSAPTI